jgi:hypothetical protein
MPAANAQATRTWVSGTGDDANPCSRTAPCKTFAGTITKTAAGGEINCLDPGGFGNVTITKAITILCGQSGIGGVLVPSGPGITVNLSSPGRVVLDGLDFEGSLTGTNGVQMIGAGFLIIRNSSIRNFTGFGVSLAGPSSTPAPRVLIQNSLITDNLSGGVNVQGQGGAPNNAVILNTLIDSNGNFGVQHTGPGTTVLGGSVLTGNTASVIVGSGGTVVSYGNNVLRPAATLSSMALQ